jgi:hypothetical protein
VAVIRPSFPEDHFTRVPNAWLRDPELPAACKGYLSYLLSHAAGYACSTSQAARDMGANRSTVTAWNAKLVERGYFVAVEQTRDDGRFGANDYTITSCTSARPPLPENPALFPRETAQSTVSGKPRTVEPSRETRHIEEHGEKNTPDPADQGASTDRRGDREARRVETVPRRPGHRRRRDQGRARPRADPPGARTPPEARATGNERRPWAAARRSPSNDLERAPLRRLP